MQPFKPKQPRPNVYYHRKDGNLSSKCAPDLLLSCHGEFIPIVSDNVMFFSRIDDKVKVYCIDHQTYTCDLTFSELIVRISHFSNFRRVQNTIIVNIDRIASYRKNGSSYIFMKSGDEIQMESSTLTELINVITAA